MPIYEYKCSKCSHQFELFQKITDKPEGICPKCNGKGERIISQTSFSLKGGGWYKDGYSSAGSAKTEKRSSGGTKKKD